MDKINAVIADHEIEIKHLLRRYRVLGEPNLQTIKTAHDRWGEPFMMKLLRIITPQSQEAAFTSLITPENPFVYQAMEYQAQQNQEAGKGWTFWEKLLNGVSKTGETIGQFKQDVKGNPEFEVVEYNQAPRQNTVFIIAGAVAVLVVLILILKN